MPDKFSIFSVPEHAAELNEQMGTKFKFWFDVRGEGSPLSEGRFLYKEGRPNTGENWAEKVACELASALGIAHANYELAEWKGRKGIISPTFVPESGRLIHGNELIGGRSTSDENQPQVKQYAQREHMISTVLGFWRSVKDAVRLPLNHNPVMGISSPLDMFTGYLLFDSWIANQDRHSENWGIVRYSNAFHMAPSYDHGSSLGRNETDKKRMQILSTKDKGSSLRAYVERARSALFPNRPQEGAKPKTLATIDTFKHAQRVNPNAARAWLDRLEDVSEKRVETILNKIPDEYMSPITKEFTGRLLKLNRDRLLELKEKP